MSVFWSSEFSLSVFSRIRTKSVDLEGLNILIQSKSGKIPTRETPNSDNFHVGNPIFVVAFLRY